MNKILKCFQNMKKYATVGKSMQEYAKETGEKKEIPQKYFECRGKVVENGGSLVNTCGDRGMSKMSYNMSCLTCRYSSGKTILSVYSIFLAEELIAYS